MLYLGCSSIRVIGFWNWLFFGIYDICFGFYYGVVYLSLVCYYSDVGFRLNVVGRVFTVF